MSAENTLSRRQVMKGAATAAVAATVPVGLATLSQEKADAISDTDMKTLEMQLAKPFDAADQGYLKAAMHDVRSASKDRMKHKLTENSEPSFVFSVRETATSW